MLCADSMQSCDHLRLSWYLVLYGCPGYLAQHNLTTMNDFAESAGKLLAVATVHHSILSLTGQQGLCHMDFHTADARLLLIDCGLGIRAQSKGANCVLPQCVIMS